MKHLPKILLSSVLLSLLASCTFNSSSSASIDDSSSNEVTSSLPGDSSTTSGPSSGSETSSDTSSGGSGEESSDTSTEEPSTGMGYHKGDAINTVGEYSELGIFLTDGACPSVGSPKMLVLPIVFSDIATSYAWTDSEISMLNEAYTSDNLEEEAFYSLEKYYSTSSYGKLTIDVIVHDPITLGISQSTFERSTGGFYTLFNDIIEQMADNGENLGDYDSDGDGYVDGIHLIYKTSRSTDSETWWHYTTYLSDSEISSYLDVPSSMTADPRVYFFSRFDGLDSGYYGEGVPDTHTIIHETGHMLGLDDYYDYSGSEAPAGMADMMDFNVGDHNPYSKMLLGWADPYVVDGTSSSFEITLKPFESSGDFILLRNTEDAWNGTPYDEYLVLSYYTPTGINSVDSDGYEEWSGYGHGGTYANSGIQVFHIDSRTIVAETTSYGGVSRGHYYNPETDEVSDIYQYGASNTSYYSTQLSSSGRASSNSSYRLIEAMTSDGVDNFANINRAVNYFGISSNLFTVGSTYTNSKMSSYFVNGTSFNDGTTLDYSFEVTSMNDEGITISFSSTD